VTESDRSITRVLTDILGDLQQIVRAEVRLAKVELREELGKAKRGATLMLAGALVAMLALGLVLLSAVYGLATVWPPWAAALAVAAGAGAVGLGLVVSGRKQISAVELPPQKTAETVRENLQWAKTRAK
jgi:uncharacterized membrane protein YqjE